MLRMSVLCWIKYPEISPRSWATAPTTKAPSVISSLNEIRTRPFLFRPAEARRGPNAASSPTQRDRHILTIQAHGRMHWQKASGYNRRARVEAAIGRYKRVIGDALKSRADERRNTEAAIAVKTLNSMREFGQAEFGRVA